MGFDLCVLQAKTMLETFGLLKPCSPLRYPCQEVQSGPPLCPWKLCDPGQVTSPGDCFFSFFLFFNLIT